MSDRRFDEAYIIKDKCFFMGVDELIQEYSSDRDNFNSEYAGYLYCPECKKVQLESAFGGESKYLKTWRKKLHSEGCQYAVNVKMASPKQIKDYAKKVNPQTIENNLWHLLLRLGNTQIESKPNAEIAPTEFTFSSQSLNKKSTTRVCIHQQKIKNGKNEFPDDDMEKYYYGEVWLEINNNPDNDNVQLKVYSFQNNQKKNFICSVFVSRRIDISSKTNNYTDGKYYVAFFGKMIKAGDKKQFNNLRIYDKHNIVLKYCKSDAT